MSALHFEWDDEKAAVNVKKNKILRGNQRDFVNSFQPDRGLAPDTRGTPFATIVSGNGTLIGLSVEEVR